MTKMNMDSSSPPLSDEGDVSMSSPPPYVHVPTVPVSMLTVYSTRSSPISAEAAEARLRRFMEFRGIGSSPVGMDIDEEDEDIDMQSPDRHDMLHVPCVQPITHFLGHIPRPSHHHQHLSQQLMQQTSSDNF